MPSFSSLVAAAGRRAKVKINNTHHNVSLLSSSGAISPPIISTPNHHVQQQQQRQIFQTSLHIVQNSQRKFNSTLTSSSPILITATTSVNSNTFASTLTTTSRSSWLHTTSIREKQAAPIAKHKLTPQSSLNNNNNNNRNNKNRNNNNNQNMRAKVKMLALAEARTDANSAYNLYQSLLELQNDNDANMTEEEKEEQGKTIQTFKEKYIQKERLLMESYSKAIKYVARTRSKDSALKAEKLLYEMMERCGLPESRFMINGQDRTIDVISTNDGGNDNSYENVEGLYWNSQNVDYLDRIVGGEDSSSSSSSKRTTTTTTTDPSLEILPQRRDFENVLHGWAASKARKKGQYAESILLRMLELEWLYPDTNWSRSGDSGGGRLVSSKVFALVVKCYAGSTYKHALPKICNLHHIHNQLVQRNKEDAILNNSNNDDNTAITIGEGGIIRKDDPLLLLHSIKAVKNYRNPDNVILVEDWIERLHSFVMDPTNVVAYYNANDDGEGEDGDADTNEEDYENHNHRNATGGNPIKPIDLTGTYSTVIREYAKLNGEFHSLKNAAKMLQKMQEVSAFEQEHTLQQGNMDSDVHTIPPTIATIDIKSNAYNLVLGLYNSSKKKDKIPTALNLLKQMMESWNNRQNESKSTTDAVAPYPTDQSFTFCISALAQMTDKDAAKKEAERLLSKLEAMYGDSDATFVPSTKPYNACLEVYASVTEFSESSMEPSSIAVCFNIIRKMTELAAKYPGVKPDISTWTAFMQVCAVDTGDTLSRGRKLETAEDIYVNLRQRSAIDSLKPNEKSFYYMMRSIVSHVKDPEEKEKKLGICFEDACKMGLVSSNVLQIFKNNVSKHFFQNIAGDGRLADNWVANVTSAKALYTDGSMGGLGKNARRKGKSTSSWLKKEKTRVTTLRERKKEKTNKKMQKKHAQV